MGSSLRLLALCLGYFMVIIDVTIVNVALPSLGRNLGAGVAGLQWVVDGYTLAFASILLSAGHMSDKIGARGCFVSGLLGFAFASAGCAVATSVPVLCGARVLQGISAALIVPSSLALIHQAYPDKPDRSRAIGIWAGIGGVAAATGPVLGGVFVHFGTWRWVFWVNVPITATAIVLTIWNISSVKPRLDTTLDLPAQLLAACALALLTTALITAGRLGWTDSRVLICLGLFVVFALGFIFRESQAGVPMLPLELFSSTEGVGAVSIGFILNAGFYGQLFLLPFFFQEDRGYSAFLTAMAILPQPSLASVASYLGGKYVGRMGATGVMIVGLAIGALGFAIFSYGISISAPYIVLLIPLMAVGFGTAFTMPAVTIAALEAVPETRSGVAAGFLNAFRQVGSLVGVAVFGTLIGRLSNIAAAMQLAAMVAAFLFGAGAIMSGFIKIKETLHWN